MSGLLAPSHTVHASLWPLTPCNAVVRASGAVEWLAATGMVIVLMPEARFTQASTQLGAGDTVVLFTDGVTEATNPRGEEFGDVALAQLVTGNRDLAPAELETLILGEVDRFSASETQQDDQTLVVARVPAPGSERRGG